KILSYLGEVIVNGNAEVKGPRPEFRSQPRAPAAKGEIPEGARPVEEAWSPGIREMGTRAEAAARHRHDNARRPSIVARDADAQLRHAADRAGLRPQARRPLFARDVGRG